MLRNQKGFTLIEIIAVLIILGILAAVAVPKYLDIADEARIKAAQLAIAEIKSRASLAYGKYLLVNDGVQPSNVDALNVNSDVGSDYDVGLSGGTGTTLTITVSKVQGVALTSNVTGTWTVPTQ